MSKHKMHRSNKNKKLGKYARQFARTVKRTGKWRGRKVVNGQVEKPVINKRKKK